MVTTTTSQQTGRPAVLAVVCLALFFGVLNGSAVAVVLPEIGADLDIDDADLSWVLSGFLLTYGVAIPFYGRLANRFGARNLFLIGVTIFGVGSILSAVSAGLPTLLGARTIQAAGGAAVPGLGMTLASQAFPAARRGVVLGIVSATMGIGAAAGPLAAGVVSQIADWRYLFAVSAVSIISVPIGIRHLEQDESRTNEPLDLAGGALFGLGVASTLYFVTRGSQTSWSDSYALVALVAAVVALLVFSIHQQRGTAPFIPTTLIRNRSYLILTLLGFGITFANLAAQIGYPFAFSDLHDMSTLSIGLALIPSALTTAVVGVIAGRIADKTGAGLPIRVGASLMIVSTIAISWTVGSSAWTVALIAMGFAAGFALVNTPLAAVASLLVDPKDLAAALSLNTMMFFIGGSFGATLFSSVVLNSDSEADAWNPLHDTAGAGFSNAFAVLAIPAAIGLLLSAFLPRRTAAGAGTDPTEATWSHNCEVPWCPEVADDRTLTTTGATRD
ncbi:MAG: MFS transporter [Actinomycetota bacterium]